MKDIDLLDEVFAAIELKTPIEFGMYPDVMKMGISYSFKSRFYKGYTLHVVPGEIFWRYNLKPIQSVKISDKLYLDIVNQICKTYPETKKLVKILRNAVKKDPKKKRYIKV